MAKNEMKSVFGTTYTTDKGKISINIDLPLAMLERYSTNELSVTTSEGLLNDEIIAKAITEINDILVKLSNKSTKIGYTTECYKHNALSSVGVDDTTATALNMIATIDKMSINDKGLYIGAFRGDVVINNNYDDCRAQVGTLVGRMTRQVNADNKVKTETD